MTLDTCREIAARIWCDKAYQHVVMDVHACEKIARELYEVQKNQPLKFNQVTLFRLSQVGYLGKVQYHTDNENNFKALLDKGYLTHNGEHITVTERGYMALEEARSAIKT